MFSNVLESRLNKCRLAGSFVLSTAVRQHLDRGYRQISPVSWKSGMSAVLMFLPILET